MRAHATALLIIVALATPGCALPDWMVPRFWKTPPDTTAAGQSQQNRYDRQVKKYGVDTINPMGARDYIPGSSSNPFVPTQVSPQ